MVRRFKNIFYRSLVAIAIFAMVFAEATAAVSAYDYENTGNYTKMLMSHANKGVYVENGWNKAPIDATFKGTNAKKIPILAYHFLVSDSERKDGFKNNTLHMPESVFEKQMNYLHKNGYRTISSEEFYLWYKGKIKLPKKTVMITFDDASYSVIKYALPILKKYDMKATIFTIGESTNATTNTRRKWTTIRGKKYQIYRKVGMDIIREVNNEYPNVQFESHSYGLHNKTKKEKPFADAKNVGFLKRDTIRNHKKLNCAFLAYPFGKANNKYIKAASENGIVMGFLYGSDGYATQKQGRFRIKRIKVNANLGLKGLTRWLK